MRKKVLQKTVAELAELDLVILHNPDDFNLYYQRGYLHFVLEDEKASEIDYIKAVSLGLDCTKYPYYKYSESQCSRSYSVLEKIILVLFIVFFFVLIALDSVSFLYRIKTQFFG